MMNNLRISRTVAGKKRVKDEGSRVCDLKDAHFLHCEMRGAREERLPVQSSVVDVRTTKAISMTPGVCVAVIENSHLITTKFWTPRDILINSHVLLFRFQHKFPCWKVSAGIALDVV
jgi:hypothetical protein